MANWPCNRAVDLYERNKMVRFETWNSSRYAKIDHGACVQVCVHSKRALTHTQPPLCSANRRPAMCRGQATTVVGWPAGLRPHDTRPHQAIQACDLHTTPVPNDQQAVDPVLAIGGATRVTTDQFDSSSKLFILAMFLVWLTKKKESHRTTIL